MEDEGLDVDLGGSCCRVDRAAPGIHLARVGRQVRRMLTFLMLSFAAAGVAFVATLIAEIFKALKP